MTYDFDEIRRLIKKYGLVLSQEYDGTRPESEYRDERYGFNANYEYVSGHAIGINNHDKEIWFGDKCVFMEEYGEIVYESWERHKPENYERTIQRLRKQFNESMLARKKYIEANKLKEIEADFA